MMITSKEIKTEQKRVVPKKSNIIRVEDVDKLWNNFLDQGCIKDNRELDPREYRGIKDAWAGQPCFVVGGGKSLKPIFEKHGLDFLDEMHTIGINHIIEDYDRFEWFIFLDQAFLQKTRYDMRKYKGIIFASNKTNLDHKDNTVIYKLANNAPTEDIEHGLYNGNLSGLVALNLAIISGANPIYLLGYGNGNDANHLDYHYKQNYAHVDNSEKKFLKYKGAYGFFDAFKKYSDRVVHVTDGNDIGVFKNKMKTEEFEKQFIKPDRIKIEARQPVICHVSFTDKLELHGEHTRACIQNGYGKHILHDASKGAPPNADFYIYENFISTRIQEKNFLPKHKSINIVHTMNCFPTGNWHKIVALTNYWKRHLIENNVPRENIIVIPAGINIDDYKNIKIDYESKIFGRMTRYSAGKIHELWNPTIQEILNRVPDSSCIMFTQLDDIKTRPTLTHDRMIYDKSVKIDNFKGAPLSRLSLYVHANGFFRETFSLAIIEAMACGLPIVYLHEDAIHDNIDSAGISCKTMLELKEKVIDLLEKPEEKEYYGKRSKERVKLFHVNNFVQGIDKIIKEYLR